MAICPKFTSQVDESNWSWEGGGIVPMAPTKPAASKPAGLALATDKVKQVAPGGSSARGTKRTSGTSADSHRGEHGTHREHAKDAAKKGKAVAKPATAAEDKPSAFHAAKPAQPAQPPPSGAASANQKKGSESHRKGGSDSFAKKESGTKKAGRKLSPRPGGESEGSAGASSEPKADAASSTPRVAPGLSGGASATPRAAMAGGAATATPRLAISTPRQATPPPQIPPAGRPATPRVGAASSTPRAVPSSTPRAVRKPPRDESATAAGMNRKGEVKAPAREDGAPSRHSIPKAWSSLVDPVLLFNCAQSACHLVSGDFASFGDSTDGQLKAVHSSGGEVVGRVTVARYKAEPVMDRVEFRNRWLVGDEGGLVHDGLDRNATIDISIEWNDGSGGRAAATLRASPWLAYACAAGSRLRITLPSHEYDGACVTVQRVLDDDRCVCTVDGVDKETLIDPRPTTAVRTTRTNHILHPTSCILHPSYFLLPTSFLLPPTSYLPPPTSYLPHSTHLWTTRPGYRTEQNRT